jgi:spore coat polysaccharide biosynthesis protein SpsF
VRAGEVQRAKDRPVICISQARTGSTRLPGKVMLPVLGRPLLSWHLTRLRRAKAIDQVVVATTVLPQDDTIVELCRGLAIPVFRGSEDDVLSRYLGAAAMARAATIVRVTSDCPLIDPTVIDELVEAYRARRPALDYASLDRADFPRGLDAEVFSRAALEEAGRNANAAAEREHVTPYLYRPGGRFRCFTLANGAKAGHLRWCVDEAADFELVRRMIEALAPERPDFTWRDGLALLAAHPDWAELNRAVVQKKVEPSS